MNAHYSTFKYVLIIWGARKFLSYSCIIYYRNHNVFWSNFFSTFTAFGILIF